MTSFTWLAAVVLPFLAQDPATQRPAFEVASVKANKSNSGNSSNSANRTRYVATNFTLKALILQAYRLQDYQLIGGPSWISNERFDIDARAEASAIPDRIGPRDPNVVDPLTLMLQSLLEDRFQLKVRRDTRELPVYVLTVGKDGVKAKASADQTAATPTGRAVLGTGAPGIANPAPGSTYTSRTDNRAEMNSSRVGVSSLVGVLSRELDRPVIDKTDLNGFFDFRLRWTPERLSTATLAEPSGYPSIFTAVDEQLGLKLESTKGPVDVLVIDRVERPSEN